ncbi:hypothetical protein [Rufibacter roseus]|uniref:Lipoprotein n=1 Tax=Rufibacter roseus TaxID=1567108 RepID=A0ABW2DFP8_9BACT|nr:hypothetical protein [Rufibacter roseus]
MKLKIFSQIFALGLLLQLVACQIPEADMLEGEKQLSSEGVWLAYHETQCADPWGYCNKNPDKLVCVKEHLANIDVTVFEATVTGTTGGPVCMACQCGTGRSFKVRVKSEDVDKVLAIGFKKI